MWVGRAVVLRLALHSLIRDDLWKGPAGIFRKARRLIEWPERPDLDVENSCANISFSGPAIRGTVTAVIY
jgi:hypothetical protein